MSCMVMMSPSMPTISEICIILRVPSERRLTWMTTLMALAICCRMARSGSSRLAIEIIVSSRLSASRGVLAWSVVSEPSWPVFMAWSMSIASAPATLAHDDAVGPHTQRVDQQQSLRHLARPSMLAGRVSSRTTWGCLSWSSAESSMVTIRSVGRNERATGC